MPYIDRLPDGSITGLYAAAQSKAMTEFLAEDSPEIVAYRALTNAPPLVDISDRQFAQGLAKRGLISETEAFAWVGPGTLPAAIDGFVSGLPADQQFDARMILTGATSFRRDHALTEQFGRVTGLIDGKGNAAALDEFWRFCASL